MYLMIKNGHVITMTGADELPRADVLVHDGRIAAIGPDLVAPEEAEVIDAGGKVVLPGFVDSHRHVWQAPLRGIGPDMTLGDYLRDVLGAILPTFGPAELRAATLLGAAEALDAGITTVFDWSNGTRSAEHTDAILDGFAAAGIRAVVAHANPDDHSGVRRLASFTGSALVTPGLAILGPEYGPFDVAARQIAFGRELGLVVSMHLGGSSGAIAKLGDANLLGPDLNFVHLNTVDDDEIRLLVDTGAGITVTPTVEETMGHGASVYGRFVAAGGAPALGVDVVVNSVPDLFEPMRATLRAERRRRGWHRDPLPAAELLRSVTIDGARAIGLGDEVGSLAVGKRADLVILDGLEHLAGGRAGAAVAGAVVTSLRPSDVGTVIVGGNVVKRDGHLVDHNLATLRSATTTPHPR